MKTVTLVWGELWGQPKGCFVTLIYRGRSLKEWQCDSSQVSNFKLQALYWAHNQGYTHYMLAGQWRKFSISVDKCETKPAKVKALARQAVFYVGDDGIYLRMQYCNSIDFCCTDENTGEDYTIPYNEVDLDRCKFYKLTKLEA